ncbi:MAG TPA: S8 family serine peptidase, partial [bacterium]|nr:S8 family serine peptidase [bacterium]
GDCDVAQPNWELEAPEVNQGVVAFVEGGHVFSDVEDQGALARIGTVAAHLQYQGTGTVVAVLDTGVDLAHPDLAGAFLPGWDFVDDDADPNDVADGVDQDEDGLVDEGAGHGTHVAGIIHAVAPGAQILPVRVMDSEGVGNSAGIARGILWAVDNGADVINLSLGMRVDADVMKEALDYADSLGVLVVASAGNEGIQESHHFPANLSKVVAVTATDANDLKAPFSNYGSYVNLSAPGEGILSTFLGGQYAVWSGTSFAAPMVAGGAALWYERFPGGIPDDATEAVEDTASPLDTSGTPYDGKIGTGLLDCAALVLWTPSGL